MALSKETLKAPTFSKTYTVKGTLYIPYAEIREPFYAWYNGNSGSSRIDYYGGISKIIIILYLLFIFNLNIDCFFSIAYIMYMYNL